MPELLNRLKELKDSDIYPFHMPGHKRNSPLPCFEEAFGMDITETEGFGDLYSHEGILEDLKEKAAKVYGAKKAFILVNGSTVGNLSAISSTVKHGGKLLLAANSHRSAYNAVFLKELESIYMEPSIIAPYVMSGGIAPEDVGEILDEQPETEAVFITSPTYEGMISDVAGIAEVCHERNKLLIVDSAHGAYLGFDKGSTELYRADNAVKQNADIVVESLHKTLPSFTQTALMFVNGDRVDEERLEKYFGVFQTSSPSYLFMAGISACLDYIDDNEEFFADHFRRVEKLREDAGDFRNIQIAGRELIGENDVYGIDPFKLVIHHDRISGEILYRRLYDKYHLACERYTDDHVLVMTTPSDTQEGLNRLFEALSELDDSETGI